MYLTRLTIRNFSRRTTYSFSAQDQILWKNFSDIQKNIIDLTNNHRTLSDQHNQLSYRHDKLDNKYMELRKEVNNKVEFDVLIKEQINRFQDNTDNLKVEINNLENTKDNLEKKYKREIYNFDVQGLALEGSDISVGKAKEILDALEYMKKQEKE